MATLQIRKLLATTAPGETMLVRVIVGGVFLSEGIQKFLYPDALGAGRFAQIGIPVLEIMGPFLVQGASPTCNKGEIG